MTETVENLILDLVEWVGRKERTYQETMDAWRTSCPRLPVWEDATERGLVETASANGRSLVRATPAGLGFLKKNKTHALEALKHAACAGSRELERPNLLGRQALRSPPSVRFGPPPFIVLAQTIR